MDILDIETAIIDLLVPVVPNLKVEGFPDKPVGYKLKHSTGAVLVSYQGSTFAAPITNPTSQSRTVTFDITLIVKDLRTHNGAYQYIDLIRATLTGYRIPDLARLYPVSEGFLNEQNGIWQWGMSFALNIIHEEVEA